MPTFAHEMLREIYEQPQALRRTINLYLAGRALKPDVAAALASWPNIAGEILIAASGSSRHSGLYGEILLEDLCGLAVDVEYASEYSCRGGPDYIDLRHPSVLVLSQSGETSDTLAALAEARRQDHKTLAITNAAASTMATEADVSMPLAAGVEKAIPATKSFSCQLAMLYLLALYEGARLGRMDSATLAAHIDELLALPALLEAQLDSWRDQTAALARKYSSAATFLYLGCGIHYAIAREGALKLKEASYVHAEGYPAGELKHGPNALVDETLPVVVLATCDHSDPDSLLRYRRTLEVMKEVKSRRGSLVAVATEGDTEVANIAAHVFYVPAAPELLLPVVEVIPLQLFAYHVATKKGYDVDHPRNLVKSVVTE